MLTLIDENICKVINEVSSCQVYYVCEANLKQINDTEIVQWRLIDHATFKLGLLSLRAWIQFFECLDFKVWREMTK